jgi:DNA adenine methylase
LYLNHYDHEQHIKVSREIMKINNIAWIVSYDNTPEIEDMYTSSTTYSWKYAFNHSAYRSKK